MELSSYLQNRQFRVTEEAAKFEYEYKALGDEMYQHFKASEGTKIGRRIFPLFSSPRYPHRAIRDAWKAYQQGEVKTFLYFMGILNKLVDDTR